MKRQYGKIMQRLAALTLGVFLILSSVAQAAVNTATGDVAGVGGDLVDSFDFTLTTSTPTLVKTAFLAGGGAALADNDVLPVGTSIDFLILRRMEIQAYATKAPSKNQSARQKKREMVMRTRES